MGNAKPTVTDYKTETAGAFDALVKQYFRTYHENTPYLETALTNKGVEITFNPNNTGSDDQHNNERFVEETAKAFRKLHWKAEVVRPKNLREWDASYLKVTIPDEIDSVVELKKLHRERVVAEGIEQFRDKIAEVKETLVEQLGKKEAETALKEVLDGVTGKDKTKLRGLNKEYFAGP